jgi:6-pyruvoyl-tetrahydropterin synthase
VDRGNNLFRTIKGAILYIFVTKADHDTMNYVTFEALETMMLNIRVFWDVTKCRLPSYNSTLSHIPENLNNVLHRVIHLPLFEVHFNYTILQDFSAATQSTTLCRQEFGQKHESNSATLSFRHFQHEGKKHI